jgi:hypothetical protein
LEQGHGRHLPENQGVDKPLNGPLPSVRETAAGGALKVGSGELDSIEAVGTSTAGFLGESRMGPQNQAVPITGWEQFVVIFGGSTQSTHLAHAVRGFFDNGGRRCFVVVVGGSSDRLYIGQDNGPGARSGLKCFEEIDEIALVAAPGQTSPAVQGVLAATVREGTIGSA